jgi:hypothetical protein
MLSSFSFLLKNHEVQTLLSRESIRHIFHREINYCAVEEEEEKLRANKFTLKYERAVVETENK